MTLTRLVPRAVAKPWGRRDLAPWWPDVPADGEPIGEIWFEHPEDDDPALLVKLLFTAARLSVQVHPDDAAAQARGHKRGKDEAWVVLEARPPAEIGIGLRHAVAPDALAAAARDGSIEALLDWQRVAAGDAFYSPAGTVHALGATLTLLEVQQNVDLTYRLYDYGSDRPLHLGDGIAVATAARACRSDVALEPHAGVGRRLIAAGPRVQVERWAGPRAATLATAASGPLWLFVVAGGVHVDGTALPPASGWQIAGEAALRLAPGADVIVAYAQGSAIGEIVV